MGIKFFIAIAQMLLPFVLGMTVATTAAGLTSYNTLFFGCGIIYIVLLVLVMIFPLPDTDAKAEGKKEGLIASLKHTHFSVESIAMIIIGFTCTGTFQLWLNCAQNFAKENVGWDDPSVMQSYYSAAVSYTHLLSIKWCILFLDFGVSICRMSACPALHTGGICSIYDVSCGSYMPPQAKVARKILVQATQPLVYQ